MNSLNSSFSKRTLPFLKYQSPALLWGLFISLILLLPSDNIEDDLLFGVIPQDKIVHFVLFAVFSLLNRVGWAKFYRCDFYPKKSTILVLLFSLAFAFLTELLQLLLTDYRFFSFADIAADFAGAIFGLLLFQIIYKM